MFIREAKAIADGLVWQMERYSERIQIAGSIRRGCQDVKDIELVAVPKWDARPSQMMPLFGGALEPVNLLHEWALAVPAAYVRWIKPGTSELEDWRPTEQGKYWRALINNQIKLDLFLARRDNFGLILAIRTGHRDFSSALLAHAKQHTPYQSERSYFEQRKLKGQPEGYLVAKKTGERIPTPEEQDLFDLLKLDYIEPRARTGYDALTYEGRAVFAKQQVS